MSSDIVLNNDDLVLKGSTISIEGKATFSEGLTASDIGVNAKITTLGLDAMWLAAGQISSLPDSELKIKGKSVKVTATDLLTLTGTFVKVTATDVMLDNAERRKAATGNRRALVHDFEDGLTINYDGDYPGGVKIRGNVEMPEGVTTKAATVKGPLVATTLTVKGLPVVTQLGARPEVGVQVSSWHEIVLDGKTILAKSLRQEKGHGVTETSFDLIKELQKLREDMTVLQGKIAELQNAGGQP